MSIVSKNTPKLGTLSCISLIVNKIIGTGIFSNPSIIFQYANGNVGLFLSMFLVGGIVILCGLVIYLEYALNLPFKNGGEKNYLLRVFRDPAGLMGCIYSFAIVLLGFLSGNAFAFGKYVLYAVTGHEGGDAALKLLGVACISFCIVLHIRFPNQGTQLFNVLGVFKILILVFIIVLGLAVVVGVIDVPATDNFDDMWRFHNNASPDAYSLAVGLLEVVYSFKGWENVNYVLNEIDDPVHVLTIAAPAAVAATTVLYFLVLVLYLVVIPKQEMLESGVLVAGIFFNKIFGESITARLLPVLISLLNLGNVLVVSYAHSLVNQELAFNNYIPFSRYFHSLNWLLVLHWTVTVVVLVAPPSTEIYEFVVNLYIYPGTWINILLTGGLLYLKLSRSERWGVVEPEYTELEGDYVASFDDDFDTATLRHRNNSDDSTLLLERTEKAPVRKISAPYVCIAIFFVANVFLAVFPFVPPPHRDTLAIPYWCFPTVGTLVLVLGGVFWTVRPYFTDDVEYVE